MHCPPLSFRRGENLPTLNCSSVMQAKYVWGAVWGQKSDKNSLRGNLSFAFAPTSALPGSRPNKETWKRRGWESTTQEVLRLWKILFLQFQTDRKGVFSDDHSRQHWNPSHWGFGRGDNDLYWRKLKDLKIPSFAGFFLSGRPRCGICCFCLSPVGGSVVCICWNS